MKWATPLIANLLQFSNMNIFSSPCPHQVSTGSPLLKRSPFSFFAFPLSNQQISRNVLRSRVWGAQFPAECTHSGAARSTSAPMPDQEGKVEPSSKGQTPPSLRVPPSDQ